mgnify:CR=1 FL=1
MKKEDLNKILELRKELIDHYRTLRDYKSNKNALIKEVDHAERVHRTIVKLDDILRDYVNFS